MGQCAVRHPETGERCHYAALHNAMEELGHGAQPVHSAAQGVGPYWRSDGQEVCLPCLGQGHVLTWVPRPSSVSPGNRKLVCSDCRGSGVVAPPAEEPTEG